MLSEGVQLVMEGISVMKSIKKEYDKSRNKIQN